MKPGLYNARPTSPKWCKTVGDVPDAPHFVILVGGSIHVPDEPGYPGGSEPVLEYRLYTSREDWQAAVEELAKKGDLNWKAVQVVPAKVTKTITVAVE